ncbi:hypothetical protein [Micromonospora kangleipakensis]|nr:hypothetical protein [Micromonospora kangleipakensis]
MTADRRPGVRNSQAQPAARDVAARGRPTSRPALVDITTARRHR